MTNAKYSMDELRKREIDIDQASEEIGDSFALDTARAFLAKRKLPVPLLEPEYIEQIQFPKNMANMTDGDVTQAMAEWTSLMSYAKYLVTEADIEKTAKTNKYNHEKSKAWMELRSSMTEEDTRKSVERHKDVSKAKQQADVASAKYKLMDALLWGYTKNYQMLSRELTKRGIITPGEGKG